MSEDVIVKRGPRDPDGNIVVKRGPGRPRKVHPASPPANDGMRAPSAEDGMAAPSTAAPAQRASVHKGVHKPPREPVHAPSRSDRVVAVGRDGEVLTRDKAIAIDPFDGFPAPPGWEYQWNLVSIIGNTDVARDQASEMRRQGWRPVPASRYPEHGYVGNIERGGVRLEERPKSMSDEARDEDRKKAYQLISDRNESLKLSLRELPPGMAQLKGDQRRVLRTGGDNVRMSIDTSLADQIPQPSHQVASGGDE